MAVSQNEHDDEYCRMEAGFNFLDNPICHKVRWGLLGFLGV
jgi:hypothetical protein